MGKTVGNVTFTPEELATTFKTYRQELIVMVMLSMQQLLDHVSIRTGIRYRDIVSEMSGNFEFGNYKKDKLGKGSVDIKGRVFETFFGNCVEPIDPNAIYQSIWGSNVTKGDGLKNVSIVLQVASYIVKKIWENTLLNSFTATHDASDTTATSKWFNGFKTIIDNDIAGTNEDKQIKISADINNLQLGTASISKDNAEDLIKDFFWSRKEKLRGQQLKLFMSDMSYHYYTESYQLAHGSLPYNQTYDKKTLEGASNVELVPLSFVPSDFLLLTPKSNIFALYNQKTDDENYICEKSLNNHYDIDIIANAFFGTQFQSVSPEIFSVWEKKVS